MLGQAKKNAGMIQFAGFLRVGIQETKVHCLHWQIKVHIEMEKLMSKDTIIRAWKDPAYRNGLSQGERAALPANPAGSIEISDADLGKVAGGKYNPTIQPCLSFWVLCSLACSRIVCA